MRHPLRKLCLALSFACQSLALQQAHAQEANTETKIVGDDIQVISLAQDFVNFWDASQSLPMEQRVSTFKRDLATRFPEFYADARYPDPERRQAHDKHIARAIQEFPEIREGYLSKARDFQNALTGNILSFKKSFPDFQMTLPIYLLHSLGEMDGGTRDLNQEIYFIFGVDGMLRYHQTNNDSAFFHHELFHIYHLQAMRDCPQPGLWGNLWTEGLAVYVSQVLNPSASPDELLLDFPTGSYAATVAKLPESFAHLETKILESENEQLYAALFTAAGKDDSGLPARRGYYLGYLVARELGKTHSLTELAKMSCSDARKEVIATVNTLRAVFAQQPPQASHAGSAQAVVRTGPVQAQ